MKYLLWTSVAGAALLSFADPARAGETQKGESAAEAEDSRTYTDEIVVTARKRAESVQDIPISVAALSGDALQASGITTFEGLTSATSGFTALRNANNNLTFRVRGLGTGAGNDGYEQSVALFIDGSYAGRSPEYNQAMFDVERVEIIKGTQAALLAKNTSLGAVSLTSRKPGEDWAFNGTATYEMAFSSLKLDAGVDIPLSDTLFLRLAGQSDATRGYIRNVALGTRTPRIDALAGRAVLVWKPNADLDATLLYQQFRSDTHGVGEEVAIDSLGVAAGRAALAGVPFQPGLDYRQHVSGGSFGDTYDRTTGHRAIGTVNYDMGGYTLTSVSAYSRFQQNRQMDADAFVGMYTTQVPFNNGNRQFTQELRISSPAEDPFNFVAGLFYLNEDFDLIRSVDVRPDGLPGGSTLNGENIDYFDQNTKNYAAFGQANLEIGSGLSASLGLRLNKEDRTVTLSREIVRAGSLAFLFPGFAPATLSRSATTLDGSVGLQYKPDSDKLFYISASRGTKSGGYLTQGTNASTAAYPAERADTIEAGTKLSFGRSHLNFSLFQTDISDLQQALFLGGVFDTTPLDVRSRGAELDFSLRATDALRFSGSVTYSDAKILTGVAPVKGSQPLNAPKWTGNADIDYSAPIGGDFSLDANLGAEFSSQRVWSTFTGNVCTGPNPASALVPCTDPYVRFNARLAIGPDSGRWKLSLIGRNIFDRKVVAYARVATFITGASMATLAPPRTMAIQFTLNR
ncbi:TonB-dependent receptor [Sphingomonas colocasiae]|nr:TonB-dependent receptor [Sphingomonas colocasiae]